MKYLLRASLLIIICILTSSCIKHLLHKDPNPGLFACSIDGKDFVPDDGSYFILPPVAAAVSQTDNGYTISIAATKKVNSATVNTITLSLENVTGPGVYEFNDTLKQQATYENGKRYVASKVGHGSLTLTKLYTGSKTIEGTFWFNAGHRGDTDSIKVTNGHFNISGYNLR